MVGNLHLVVKNDKGEYLKEFNHFVGYDKARCYKTWVAFTDAKDNNGKVFLRFPSGKEIEVSEEEFEK